VNGSDSGLTEFARREVGSRWKAENLRGQVIYTALRGGGPDDRHHRHWWLESRCELHEFVSRIGGEARVSFKL
jgi:hypothetical protein